MQKWTFKRIRLISLNLFFEHCQIRLPTLPISTRVHNQIKIKYWQIRVCVTVFRTMVRRRRQHELTSSDSETDNDDVINLDTESDE